MCLSLQAKAYANEEWRKHCQLFKNRASKGGRAAAPCLRTSGACRGIAESRRARTQLQDTLNRPDARETTSTPAPAPTPSRPHTSPAAAVASLCSASRVDRAITRSAADRNAAAATCKGPVRLSHRRSVGRCLNAPHEKLDSLHFVRLAVDEHLEAADRQEIGQRENQLLR